MTTALHEADFALWAQEQAAALRRMARDRPELGAELDLANLADEIADMSKSQLRELRSRCLVLLMHLAKWRWQAERRSRSWRTTVSYQRAEIGLLLLDNPSLRPRLPSALDEVWRHARAYAADETGLGLDTFTATCPFTSEQVLEEGWLPD